MPYVKLPLPLRRKASLLLLAWGLLLTSPLFAQSPTSAPTSKSSSDVAPEIRNVILMIGDGMGPQQLGLLFSYAHEAPSSQGTERVAAMEQMSQTGTVAIVRTEPHGALVADSAAAATQLATGQPSGSEMIGVNYLGDRAPTVLEIAKQQGKSTGLISDTRITHATPAAFGAHQRHRSMENEIAADLLENEVDVLLSGGLRHWLPKAINDRQSAAYMAALQMTGGQFELSSKRQDNRNLLLEARRDYQLAFDRTSLAKAQPGKLLGLFANSEMHDALSERQTSAAGDRTQPTLVEMTTKAVELLDQNPQGFFLMVEGGQIDWAGHNNDTGTMLHELLQFDDAVRAVLAWAEGRDDTLILVTADHETGGFGFSYSGTSLPEPRTLAGDAFQGETYLPNFNFARPALLDQIHAQEKSFYQIFGEFDALPAKEHTPEKLQEIVNASMPFQITLDDALAILTRERNRMYSEKHKYLGAPTVPKVQDFATFHVFGENSRMNLLGRALAGQQNTVWATATHTSTPVLLLTSGPEPVRKRFAGLLHSTDVGQRMIHVVRGN